MSLLGGASITTRDIITEPIKILDALLGDGE